MALFAITTSARAVLAGSSLGLVLLASSGCSRPKEEAPPQSSPPPPAVPVVSSAPAQPEDAVFTPDKAHELFDALDLSGDAFQPIRDALAKNDLPTAEHLLADYFRQRTNVSWKFDPHHIDKNVTYNKQVADDAVNGRVTGGLVPVWYSFPNGQIDWLYNATLHQTGVAPNNEWQWQLCRMSFWGDMAAAYRATGDEKYPKAWVGQLRSYVAECPPPVDMSHNNGSISGWRTIEAGIRMSGSWPNAYFSFLLSPSVSDQDLLLYVYACRLHALYLEKFNTGGNWLTMEMNGAFTVGALFPEFKQAAEWRNYAGGRMAALEKDQFLPDGAHEELSTGYHNVAMDNITGLWDSAKLTGHTADLPPGFLDPLQKAYDFDMYMSGPGGAIPQFNDSWPNHIQGIAKRALQYFPDRKDYLWLSTDGKEGQAPAETSHAFDWAGYYVMRSSWAPDANYLVFRAGPVGGGHAHQDKLNLIFWPFGREILFNSGGGSYERSKWRQYSIDTFSKNTVLVDNLPQRRDTKNRDLTISKAPIDARWQSTPDFDFVAGLYNDAYGDGGLHPATHSRRVLFLKPDLVIVSDTLTPNDGAEHTYQARWNLLSTQTKQVPATNEIMTTDTGKPNLDVVPLDLSGLDVKSASAQTDPELLGWDVLHSGQPPYHATTILQTRHGAGVQTFLTLFVPMRPGATDPVKSVTAAAPGTTEVDFNDGRKLSIAASADPAGTTEATETLADGTPGRHVVAGGNAPGNAPAK